MADPTTLTWHAAAHGIREAWIRVPSERSQPLTGETGGNRGNPWQGLGEAAVQRPGLWEFGTADEHSDARSVQVLDELKAQGHDVTVLTFVGAGHGLLDNAPTDPDATPSLTGWVTSHDR